MRRRLTLINHTASSTEFLYLQKTMEAFFKELKFAKGDDLDEEMLINFMEKVIDEAEWRPILKSVIPECNKKVNAKFSEVQKKMEAAPYNVKKDQCNVKFGSIVACIKMESFQVKPSLVSLLSIHQYFYNS